MQYAAKHVFDETCEAPGGAGLHAFHLADMYHSYTKGRVGINRVSF